MVIINNCIQRAIYFELTIREDEIINHEEFSSLQQAVEKRSDFWGRKTFEKRQFTVKFFKIFSKIPAFNDGKMKFAFVITGHVYGGQTGKDVSGGDAYDTAGDFEEYIKTGTSPRINLIERDERVADVKKT